MEAVSNLLPSWAISAHAIDTGAAALSSPEKDYDGQEEQDRNECEGSCHLIVSSGLWLLVSEGLALLK